MSDSALRKRISIANAMDNINLNDDDVLSVPRPLTPPGDNSSEETVSNVSTLDTDNTEDFVELRHKVDELECLITAYRLQSYGLVVLVVYLLMLYATLTAVSIF